jgi:hypothetical protein
MFGVHQLRNCDARSADGFRRRLIAHVP